jgi:ribonuclease VapC
LILDSSAIVAVMKAEDGHDRLVEAMEGASLLGVGAPTLFETALVMVRSFDLPGRALVSRFLEEREVVVIPFDEVHWGVAAEALIRYGKGRHPAQLNFGDCMAYATAVIADEPLLFVGDDFSKTDVPVA